MHTCEYWEGFSPLKGRSVISVSISDNILNEVRYLQIIYSPVVIVKGLSPLTGRGVISGSILENIMNKVKAYKQ